MKEANRDDSTAFDSTVNAIPAVLTLGGRPRKCPDKLHGGKDYDCRRCRNDSRRRDIMAQIA
ncbi:hypothetical protein NQV17_29890 [Burkholderia sp. SCN-KJ]|nr:hypothetical protein [Burkholderia sp. SCN-KJ]MCR4470461.1 hypothetical protein [Burkholderia sp. SCN-KJ]